MNTGFGTFGNAFPATTLLKPLLWVARTTVSRIPSFEIEKLQLRQPRKIGIRCLRALHENL